MSRVISSGPSLVSRDSTSCFSMWMLVNMSSRTSRSLMTIASSKLPPSQLMNATRMFWPRASSPRSVELLSASGWPASTRVADLDDRALVDARALVGAHELLERGSSSQLAGVVGLDLDALGGHD